jgi:hypothetical protein
MRVLTRALVVALAVLALGALQATAADAAKLRKGVYDCIAYNYATGLLDYKASVKLKPGGRYEHSYGRKKRKLTKPEKGRYAIKGKWIRFRSGSLKKTPGRINPADEGNRHPFFSFFVDGQNSGVSCYYVTKP